ncbi:MULTISPECIES: M1 family metallopeptidase [Citricoccus]|uniref:M1 family metallopeptidase n=1 Tax=Citricoccus TaxID=169133 RepID=UPI000255F6C8|nr:M1 family metallopeptidase [Citricoccus sp. CH26A]
MSDVRPAIPDPYLPGSGTPDYGVGHYDLTLEVKLAANRVSGTARLEGTLLNRAKRVELDLHGLSATRVTAVSRDRSVKVAKYATRNSRLVIDLASPLDAGTPLTLQVTYSGVPRMLHGTWGEIGWEELEDGVLVAGQPNGACTWFPCVDHPSVKSTYHFTISTDAGYLPVCNGLPTGHRRRSSREEWTWELREPAPTYLATVQIGRYQLVAVPERTPGRHPAPGPVREAVQGLLDGLLPGRDERQQEGRHEERPDHAAPVFLATSPALQDRAQAVLGLQTEMMACFSQHFGPYPFARYTAVVTDDPLEIPLEAASLSIFGSNHLTGSWAAERLVAHELAHQWFGNALTLRQWKDIWLHEGFACYSEWLWGAESGRGALSSYARTAWRGLSGKDQDLVVADPGPELMFDDRIYKRGAMALFALRQDLGEEVFAELLRAWVREHRHATVDTAMFLDHADRHAAAAGHPAGHASEVLRPWLCQEGLPPFPASPRRGTS